MSWGMLVQKELAMLETTQPSRPAVAIQRAQTGFRRARCTMGGMQMRIRPWLRTPITAAEE
jgi:hypothetical protein